MRTIRLLVAAAASTTLALTLAACGGDAEDPGAGTGSGTPVKLKYATSSGIGFAEAPAQAAFDALREEQNIDVEVVPFQTGDLGIKALINGQVDMAVAFPQGILSANKSGADLRVFFNGKADEWVLAAKAEYTEPGQLDGKKVAVHSPTDLTNTLVRSSMKKYSIEPELLTVPGSEARVSALLQGQLDAAPVDLAGLHVLQTRQPGKFHPLIVYAEELPGLIVTNHWVAKRENLESKKEAFTTLTEYLIKYLKKALDEPEWLAGQARKHLPQSSLEDLTAQAKLYQQYKAYSENGGLDAAKMEELFKFYASYGTVQEGDLLPADQFVTTEFVDAAKKRLGVG